MEGRDLKNSGGSGFGDGGDGGGSGNSGDGGDGGGSGNSGDGGGKPIYILVAGPQASGKTTAISAIRENFPDVQTYEEAGLRVIVERGLLGGAFVSESDEREIMKRDLERIRAIAGGSRGVVVHVDETGVFSVAHARGLGYEKLADEFLPRFLTALSEVRFGLLFLDTRPEISWKRREKYYRERGMSEEELGRCKAKIERTYDEFIRLYDELSCGKAKVENNGDDVEQLGKRVSEGLNDVLRDLWYY